MTSESERPTAAVVGQEGGTTSSLPKPATQNGWSTTSPSSLGSAQVIVTTSEQVGYASPMMVESGGKKCNLLNKLCPFKKHSPLPSAQCAVTYESCGSTVPAKVKKPCFLKTFLHKKTCPGNGCGCVAGGCDTHGAIASPQDIVTVSH